MNLKHANTLHYFIIIAFSVLLIKSASLINNDPHQQPKNITITSTKTFQNSSSSSTIITKSNLREIFDFSGAGKGEGKLLITKKEFIDTSTPSSSFTHRMTSSTFRPTSSILFLTPPKPKHIASIVSELNSIELDPSGGYLTLRWSVIVVLKANSTEVTTTNSTTSKIKRSTEKAKEEKEENEVENDKKEEEEEEEVVVNLPPEKGTETPLTNFSTISTTPQTPTNSSSSTTPENITISTSTTSISPAKVEQARTPLKWVITLRRYGHAHRERVPIEDRENNLDPPFTGNKSYHYRLEHLSPESSYELCIQSVNGGRLKESAEVRRLFPLNAHASGVGGAGNPLFICKEVYVSPPETKEKNDSNEVDSEVEILGSQRKSTKTQHKNRDQIRGRLAEGEKSSEGSETPAIEVSEEAADAFVVYTAITSGSTTVLLLIVVVTFCCCRCNKRKTEHREYRQNILYSRAPAGEGNGGGSHGEGGSAPKYF